jgi:hypothetical protein
MARLLLGRTRRAERPRTGPQRPQAALFNLAGRPETVHSRRRAEVVFQIRGARAFADAICEQQLRRTRGSIAKLGWDLRARQRLRFDAATPLPQAHRGIFKLKTA